MLFGSRLNKLSASLGSTQVLGGGGAANDAFELTVETTATNESFLLPMQSVTSIDIDWGDGTVDTGITANNPTHTYATAGTHSISVTGTAGTVVFYNSGSESKLRTVTNLGSLGWTNFSLAFHGAAMTSFDAGDCDTASVTDMSLMFQNCTSLTTLDVSNFDTSSVTNMSLMFYLCSSLTSLDVSSFNTSSVTNMPYMFSGCSSLTTLDLSNFDTSSVTNMSAMFQSCSSLTTLDLSNFDTSSVTNMSLMFYSCSSLTTLDLSNFNTSSVTNMRNMFRSCSSLTTLDLSNFDTSSVTNMSLMFYLCSSLTTLDLSNFDTSSVTNMSLMFQNCTSLTTLDLSNFNTSSVTNMSNMFFSCSSLTDIVGVENFNIEGLNSTGALTNFATNVTLPTARYDALLVNWDAQEPFDNMTPHFGNSKYTAGGAAEAARTSLINGDGWTITDGGTA